MRLGKYKIRSQFIVFLVILSYFLFGNAIKSSDSIIGRFPVLELVYGFLILHIAWVQINHRKKLFLYEAILLIAYVLLVIAGLCGNFLYHYQRYSVALIDMMLLSRFIVGYFYGRLCLSDTFFKEIEATLYHYAQILSTALFLAVTINPFLRIWPVHGYRMGMPTQQLFFSHPTYLTTVSVFCLLIFFIKHRPYRIIFIAMSILTIIASGRDKGFLFLGIYLFFLCFQKFGKKVNLTYLILFGLFFYLIFSKTIAYKLFDSETAARSFLYSSALKVALLFKPIGAGFATYASNMSIVHYPKLYNELGFDRIYGFTKEDANYLADSFFAMILGQFGFIGCFLMGVIFLLFFLLIKQKDDYKEFGLLLIIFILLSTVTENFISSAFGMVFFLLLGVVVGQRDSKINKVLYRGVHRKMEETVSLNKLFSLVMRKIKFVAATTIVITILGAVFVFFGMEPEYKSTVQIIVTQDFKSEIIQNTEVQANVQLVNTYNEIIKSPFILEKVAKKTNRKYSVLELMKMVKVSNATNSQLINISVFAKNPKVSSYIATVVAETFKNDGPNVMKIGTVTVLSKSEYDTVSTKKKPIVYFTIFVLVGFILGILVAFLLIALDTTIKTDEDITIELHVPILGSVASIKDDLGIKKKKRRKRK